MHWPKVTITTDSGEQKEAVAPLIISASRSTDVPAFYGEWFLQRLAAGYVRWNNPFSGKPAYVSLRNARLIVFWSKDPRPFLPLLREIDKRGIGYYFHVTLNDYEKEGLEKGVPPLAERIDTFRRLAGMVGRERVLWRFDPLLITDTLSPGELLARIGRIGDRIAAYTTRLTVSFVSLYAKTKRNLERAGVRLTAWDAAGRESVLAGIGARARTWGLPAVTCAAGDDYGRFGIAPGKCIDDAFIAKVFGHDRTLVEFLKNTGGRKDRGQRPHCRCIISKDIGQYDTCGHRCLYCYANASPQRASDNARRHTTGSDSINA